MKFFKGVLVGTMFATGTAIMYKEGMLTGKNKMIKTGKKIAKKMGVMYNVPIVVDTIRRRYPIKWTYQEGMKSLKVNTI